METLKLKHYLAIILMVLTLTSCTKGEDKMEIIAYNTPEFKEFVKNAPISLDEAWKIQLDFMKENANSDFAYNVYSSNVLLFFVVDEYYAFTMSHVNNKKLEELSLSGIWVNSRTGDVSERKISKSIKVNQPTGWRNSKDL